MAKSVRGDVLIDLCEAGGFFDGFLHGGKVGEELVDFGSAHFFGVTFVVEEDVFLSPKDVGVAGAGGVVFEVDDVAILVEEFFLFWRIWLCHFIAFFEVAGL